MRPSNRMSSTSGLLLAAASARPAALLEVVRAATRFGAARAVRVLGIGKPPSM
jgi:hypothetical protein